MSRLQLKRGNFKVRITLTSFNLDTAFANLSAKYNMNRTNIIHTFMVGA